MDAAPSSRTLLVSSPRLLDPNFHQSVVLMLEHGDEGSYGLVLNRPLPADLGTVLPELTADLGGVPLFEGGPVGRERVQLLGPKLAGRELLPGLCIGSSFEDIPEGETLPGQLRAYLGYAGWSPGQLADEIDEGAWVVAAARAEHVLSVAPEQLWQTVLRELGGGYAWLGLEPPAPEDN